MESKRLECLGKMNPWCSVSSQMENQALCWFRTIQILDLPTESSSPKMLKLDLAQFKQPKGLGPAFWRSRSIVLGQDENESVGFIWEWPTNEFYHLCPSLQSHLAARHQDAVDAGKPLRRKLLQCGQSYLTGAIMAAGKKRLATCQIKGSLSSVTFRKKWGQIVL